MTIGQVTISAADWIASRVSDRMALMAAGQKNHLMQQAGAIAVEPSDENTGAQMDRRERDRAMLAAQESYKRVAQRIKSRLANPLPPEGATKIPAEPTTGDVLNTAMREAPRLTIQIQTGEQKAEAPAPTGAAMARPEIVFGLVETQEKKAQDRQVASVGEKEKETVKDVLARKDIDRETDLTAQGTNTALRTGLWEDLFVTQTLSQDAI